MSEADDKPWTEAQWDEFMKHADLRAARYSELMETLMDDPERDDKIDREMGWDRDPDQQDEQWRQELEEINPEEEDDTDAPDESGPTAAEELEQRDRELEQIPAYAMAYSLALKITKTLHALPDTNKRLDEEAAQAMIQAHIAAAKISGGHAMGYEDEVIGGNVVNCKRALAAARECRTALLAMRADTGETIVAPLLASAELLIPTIEQRIAELRARMWWDQK